MRRSDSFVRVPISYINAHDLALVLDEVGKKVATLSNGAAVVGICAYDGEAVNRTVMKGAHQVS